MNAECELGSGTRKPLIFWDTATTNPRILKKKKKKKKKKKNNNNNK